MLSDLTIHNLYVAGEALGVIAASGGLAAFAWAGLAGFRRRPLRLSKRVLDQAWEAEEVRRLDAEHARIMRPILYPEDHQVRPQELLMQSMLRWDRKEISDAQYDAERTMLHEQYPEQMAVCDPLYVAGRRDGRGVA